MALIDGHYIVEAAVAGSRPATRVRVRNVVQHGRFLTPRPSRYSGLVGVVVRVVAGDTLMLRLPGGSVLPFGMSEIEVLP